MMTERPRRITGKYLNEKWHAGAKHALYREDGKWYHLLKDFPGALFDANGYILFETEEEYRNCEYLQITRSIHVPDSISEIPGYVQVRKHDASGFIRIVKERTDKGHEKVTGSRAIYGTSDGERIDSARMKGLETPKAFDISEPEDTTRVQTTTYRILRDTRLTRVVKEMYGYKCQICQSAIELKDGQPYAEAHHIKPLGAPHNGPDVAANIICVCPNHHVQLDYGAVRLDKNELKLLPGHEISDEYIEYHNTRVGS